MTPLHKERLQAFQIRFKWIGSGIWEFLVNVIISTLPISTGIVVLMVNSKYNYSFIQSLNHITARGELVIYSATLMAPILYAIQKEPPPKLKRFLFLSGMCTLLFGLAIYIAGFADGFSTSIHNFSYVCLGLSLATFLTLNLVNH